MRVKIRGRWKDVDLQEMNRQDVMLLKVDLMAEQDMIKSRLDEAKSIAADEGKYADPKWYRNAERAVKIIGRNIQRCEIRLSELKGSLPEVFMDVCEDELDPKDFEEIKELAIRRLSD